MASHATVPVTPRGVVVSSGAGIVVPAAPAASGSADSSVTATPAQPVEMTSAALAADPSGGAVAQQLPTDAAIGQRTAIASEVITASRASSASGVSSGPRAAPEAAPVIVTAALPASHATPDPWAGAAALMAAASPILLPQFTVPGDEISALMLPSTPEIAQLSIAFANAAQRLSERVSAIVTFVDPLTGWSDDQAPASTTETDHAWLLVDSPDDDPVPADMSGFPLAGMGPDGAAPLIRWDTPPS